MAFKRFLVRHAHGHESIAQIMMDEELLKPEAGILDPNTLTLRGLKNGGMYTIEPLDDPRVSTMRAVRRAYLGLTEKPFYHFSTSMGRIDALIDTVGLLFNEIEFTKVECKDDIDKIINPSKDPDFQHKTIKIAILGDILAEIIAEGAVSDADGEEGEDQK